MHALFTRKYQVHRIGIILVCGLAAFTMVRARTRINQQPKVAVKPAPELVGTQWINTTSPITLASRKGKVTLIEFFAYECVNCRANLPEYEKWQNEFAPSGFTIIGIHTPELPNEERAELVKKFLQERHIAYPVVLDNDYKNWNRWNQEYWPALYLVDKKGNVRDVWLGELGDSGAMKFRAKIVALINEP